MAFAEALPQIDRLFGPIGLTEDESDRLQQDLFLWLCRFSRRPGSERTSRETLRALLMVSAVSLAHRVAGLRANEILFLPRNRGETARSLGIGLDDAEGEARP